MKILLKTLTDIRSQEKFIPPVPVDVTEFFAIDHATATVFHADLSIADIKSKWQGLPDWLDDRRPHELRTQVEFAYTNYIDEPAFLTTANDEQAEYSSDPDGNGRFGWRRPGMHLRKAPSPDVALSHGPGKRKKGKRK